jgi:hypothetical protein
MPLFQFFVAAAERGEPVRVGTVQREAGAYRWRDIIELRRQQIDAWRAARPEQPALFALRQDSRPVTECTVAGRYREPITDTGNEVAALQYSDDFITWRFIDLASGSVTREFKFSRAEGSISPFALGPGSRLLAARNPFLVSHDRNSVEILSPRPGGLEKVRLARDFQPTAAVFSGDGSLVITSEGNLIEIWDTRTGVLQRTLEGPSTIKTISSSADGKHLFALDAAGSAFVWRPFEAELNQPPLLNAGRIEDAAIGDEKDLDP